ncbi:Disease resistance protein [Actinidia chinensis var. chinensis]|uniref:Disease resistance protein n=1 Tax=Actinidia chinensis var. chinensis TaxID=1590841 RepID=A0A2R6QPY7_ACTCC|nr:Disease resistance protein [Actinidia chinensis var. chinensis]
MSHAEKVWLEKLCDVLHDAGDLVDDFAAETLLERMVTPPINLVEKVFHFFSTIGFYITMAYLLKDARDRLDDMASDRSKFYPVGKGVDLLVIRNKEREQTYSYVFEPNVVGRDADKKEIKKMIMETRNEMAFKVGQEDPRLVTIGEEIVRKCAGNPLAIRVAGSLLYSKDTEYEWLSFKLCKFPGMPRNEDFNVLEVLKFSLCHLEIDGCIILTHMPLGVGQLTCLQTLPQFIVGWEYISCSGLTELNSLANLRDGLVVQGWGRSKFRRSFFKDVKEEYLGKTHCIMNDLFHDLAKSIAGTEISIADLDPGNVVKRSHVSFSSPLDSSWEVPTCLLNASNLCSFLLPVQPKASPCYRMSFSACELIFLRFPRLRVLDLHNLWLHTLPISVGELRHLKYLNLRYNKCLVHLPSSITKLRNLQTLRLSYCEYLQELQLTYLVLNWGSPIDGDDDGNDDKLLLEPPAAPKYEEATDLQASSTVGIASFSPSPPPLVHAFVGLKGWCKISEAEATTTTEMLLPSFPRLSKSTVRYCPQLRSMPSLPHAEQLELVGISQKLIQDVANELIIDSYMGSYNVISLVFFYPCFQIEVSAYFNKSGSSCLPECIGNLTSLQEFDIFDCTKLITLSDGMQCLTTLKKLSIDLCSDFLYERCQEEVGEDWPKIAHIPEIKLGSF